MNREGLLVWMDLEMSGLDHTCETILEIATVITDGELRTVAMGPDLVIHQPDSVLEKMDAWNQSHHSSSGLTDQVRASSISLAQAEEQTLDFVAEHVSKGSAPLAGNSVHQDRLFLQGQMPRLHEYLHYRNVDVSTLKELVGRWYPAIYKRRPSKTGNHRAQSDILESIAELEFYRERVFISST